MQSWTIPAAATKKWYSTCSRTARPGDSLGNVSSDARPCERLRATSGKSRRARLTSGPATRLLCRPISEAFAHCFVGARFLPATLITDDPCIADEMSPPTITYLGTPGTPAGKEVDLEGPHNGVEHGLLVSADYIEPTVRFVIIKVAPRQYRNALPGGELPAFHITRWPRHLHSWPGRG